MNVISEIGIWQEQYSTELKLCGQNYMHTVYTLYFTISYYRFYVDLWESFTHIPQYRFICTAINIPHSNTHYAPDLLDWRRQMNKTSKFRMTSPLRGDSIGD